MNRTEAMEVAVAAVANGQMSSREAEKVYGVGRMAILRRVKGQVSVASRNGPAPLVTREMKQQIVEQIQEETVQTNSSYTKKQLQSRLVALLRQAAFEGLSLSSNSTSSSQQKRLVPESFPSKAYVCTFTKQYEAQLALTAGQIKHYRRVQEFEKKFPIVEHSLSSGEKMMVVRAYTYFKSELSQLLQEEKAAMPSVSVPSNAIEELVQFEPLLPQEKVAQCLRVSLKAVEAILADWEAHQDPNFSQMQEPSADCVGGENISINISEEPSILTTRMAKQSTNELRLATIRQILQERLQNSYSVTSCRDICSDYKAKTNKSITARVVQRLLTKNGFEYNRKTGGWRDKQPENSTTTSIHHI